MERVELHLHTNYSSLDGVNDIYEYINKAKELGFSAIAVTDFSSVQSFIEAEKCSKANNIKMIYGCELSYGDDSHIIALAKNKDGLHNLYDLVFFSYTKRNKTIPKETFDDYHTNLLYGSDCMNIDVFKNALAKDMDKLKNAISSFDYIEIQPLENYSVLEIEKEEIINAIKTIISTAKEMNKIVVATGNTHYLSKDDKIKRDAFQYCIGDDYFDPNSFFHLRSTEEMLESFSYLGKELAYELVVTNTNIICDSIAQINILDNKYTPLSYKDSNKLLKEVCDKHLKELYGDNPDSRILERYNKELSIITSCGYDSYIYVYYLLINKCKKDGYLYSTRGTISSLFVSYLLRKEGINPLKPHYYCPNCHKLEWVDDAKNGYDLRKKKCPICNKEMKGDGFDIPYETFLGPNGERIPDIDINFDIEYQSKALEYLRSLTDSDNKTYHAGMITYIKENSYKNYYSTYVKNKNIVNKPLKGIPPIKVMESYHPAGLFVIPNNIKLPVAVIKSHITMHYETMQLINYFSKFDLLGNIVPNRIKHLEELTGIKADSIDLSDNSLKDLLLSKSNVSTLGIDDWDKQVIKKIINETNPTSFEDLIKIPGFIHGTNVYLNNNDKLIQKGFHLKDLFATRDDVFTYLIDMGIDKTISYNIMEDVRKGKGLKEEYNDILFDSNINPDLIYSLDRFLYLYPKAHVLEYIRMNLIFAYYKKNYPLDFYVDYLSTFSNILKQALEGLPKEIKIKMVEYRVDELKNGLDSNPIYEIYLEVLSILSEVLESGFKVINDTYNNKDNRIIISHKNDSLIIE